MIYQSSGNTSEEINPSSSTPLYARIFQERENIFLLLTFISWGWQLVGTNVRNANNNYRLHNTAKYLGNCGSDQCVASSSSCWPWPRQAGHPVSPPLLSHLPLHPPRHLSPLSFFWKYIPCFGYLENISRIFQNFDKYKLYLPKEEAKYDTMRGILFGIGNTVDAVLFPLSLL